MLSLRVFVASTRETATSFSGMPGPYPGAPGVTRYEPTSSTSATTATASAQNATARFP